jgi:UDP-N-acetylglucosamine--N-acetylmuramyl-(pentapeptide) pyrophosphoryl-undecaprenol N-acetylglucosamine transferase
MNLNAGKSPLVAVACGGTGGHLFPGLAVAAVLQDAGCEVALMVSPKEVDQEAVKSAVGMRIVVLPAVALLKGNAPSFFRGCLKSYQVCRREFKKGSPAAVLAMGGFTSAPPILAGKRLGAKVFLHESNSIPGRANRWLSPFVDEAFVGFPEAAARLHTQSVSLTGTPVRAQFQDLNPSACRISLGLAPDQPVLVVMGGSQGAAGINKLVENALPIFAEKAPELQFLHLSGPQDKERLRSAYATHQRRAVVFPFLTEMELALGAASVSLSRAGASSLAEIAALQLPSILVPYPFAADNHQYYNARAFLKTGAAWQMDQASGTPETLVRFTLEAIGDQARRKSVQEALRRWQFADAAERIAELILKRAGISFSQPRSNQPFLWKEDRVLSGEKTATNVPPQPGIPQT